MPRLSGCASGLPKPGQDSDRTNPTKPGLPVGQRVRVLVLTTAPWVRALAWSTTPCGRSTVSASGSVRTNDLRIAGSWPRWTAALSVELEQPRLPQLPRRGMGTAGPRRHRDIRAALPGGVPVRPFVADDSAQAGELPTGVPGL